MVRNSPLCSILMAAYNADKYIAIAVASVIAQNYTDWELVIVDDGSEDWTYQIVAGFSDERIRVIKTLGNKGKTLAMKLGFNQCRGKYVLELDADDWLNADCLYVLVKAMEAQPSNVGMIYGDRDVYKELRGREYFAKTLEAFSIKDKYDMLSRLQAVGPRFYRREALERCGGWQVEEWGDGRLYEDVSVIVRILEQHQIVQIGYTGYNIRKHHNNITRMNRQKWWETMKKMILYFIERWGDEVNVVFDNKKHKVYFR